LGLHSVPSALVGNGTVDDVNNWMGDEEGVDVKEWIIR